MNSVASSRRGIVESNADEGWAWMYVLASFVIRFIYDGFLFSIGVFHESLYQYYGASSAKTSLVSSILFGTSLICAPFATCLVSRFGCRNVSVSGALIATTGVLLSLAAPRIEYLFITIGCLCGFGIGLMDFSSVVIIGAHFEKKRALAMGLSFSGSGFGSLLFAPLAAWLTQYYGFWKGSMLITSGLLLNCVVLSLLYGENSPIAKKTTESLADALQSAAVTPFNSKENLHILKPLSSKDKISTSTQTVDNAVIVQESDIILATHRTHESAFALPLAANSSVFQSHTRCMAFTDMVRNLIDLSVFSNYIFLMFNFATFVFSLGIRIPFVYTPHRAHELGLATARQASYFLAVIGLSNTVGRLAFGVLADRTSIKILHIFNVALMINGLSNFTTSLITQYYQMALYCIVFGTTFGGCACLTPVVLVELLGITKLNTSYGLLGFTSGIAIACGTPLTGMIYDQTHTYKQGFYVSGGIIVASCFLLFLIPIVQKRCPQE